MPGFQPAAERLLDIPLATVVGRNSEGKAVIDCSSRFRRSDQFLQARPERLEVTDHPQPHAILVKLVDLAFQRADEQAYQLIDFICRAFPVLGAESE